MRSDFKEFEDNLKEEIDNTHNPLVLGPRKAVDKVLMESSCTTAVKEMKAFDPTFDL
jgi:hypothetical protein